MKIKLTNEELDTLIKSCMLESNIEIEMKGEDEFLVYLPEYLPLEWIQAIFKNKQLIVSI